MIDVELWRAKVEVIAGFACGPAIMIDDDDERDARIASLLALVEIEFESTETNGSTARRRTMASITDIHAIEINASNSQIDWPSLIEWLSEHPNEQRVLRYDKHHTAIVTAGRVNKKYKGITALSERRGDAGVVILSCD